MTRRLVAFRQADVTRAVKGALAGGLEIEQVECDRDGRIIIKAKGELVSPIEELDKWIAENTRET